MAEETLHGYEPPGNEDIAYYPVAADTQLLDGDLLGWNAGNVRKYVDGDPFAGISKESRSNVGGSAGDVFVEVLVGGRVKAAIAGLTGQAQVAAKAMVYASAAGFTLLPAGPAVGPLKTFLETGRGTFKMDAVLPGELKVSSITGAGPWAQTADVDVIAINPGDAETLTIPDAAGMPGRRLTVKKVDAADRVVTLATDGDAEIDGAATYAMPSGAIRPAVVLVSDGADWHIESLYSPTP